MSDSETCLALDFETANSKRSSVCAMGIAMIQGQEIVATFSWLIRPPELYFDPYNTYIHGITEEDVVNKPEFCELWDELRKYFDGRLVLAHNASFDVSVLRHVLDEYGIPYPTFTYLCTRVVAKRVWPGLSGYGLTTVCEGLGIEFRHHDAEEDAAACARLFVQACREIGAATSREFEERTGIANGRLFPNGYVPCHISRSREALSAIRPTVADFKEHHPLFGKMVVFTGSLRSMVRKQAAQRVVDCGGRCAESVARDTNYLILGDSDFSKLRGAAKSNKLRKAESLLAVGRDIEIISEEDFLRLLAA